MKSQAYRMALLYDFYGETHGVKIARKHIAKYIANLENDDKIQHHNAATWLQWRHHINQITASSVQYECVAECLSLIKNHKEIK